MIADITRGTGRLSLAQGIVGTGVGIGASISPTLAGYLTDHFGGSVAFFGLALIAAAAVTAVRTLMPETRATGKLVGQSKPPSPSTRAADHQAVQEEEAAICGTSSSATTRSRGVAVSIRPR